MVSRPLGEFGVNELAYLVGQAAGIGDSDNYLRAINRPEHLVLVVRHQRPDAPIPTVDQAKHLLGVVTEWVRKTVPACYCQTEGTIALAIQAMLWDVVGHRLDFRRGVPSLFDLDSRLARTARENLRIGFEAVRDEMRDLHSACAVQLSGEFESDSLIDAIIAFEIGHQAASTWIARKVVAAHSTSVASSLPIRERSELEAALGSDLSPMQVRLLLLALVGRGRNGAVASSEKVISLDAASARIKYLRDGRPLVRAALDAGI